MIQDNSSELWAAYAATTFCAQTTLGEVRIHIGAIEPTLDALLAVVGATDWAFITAWNPASEQCSDAENRERQSQLEQCVVAAGYRYFQGFGVGSDGNWPPEPSLLILGMSRAVALLLGHRFGQNAIVWGSIGNPAELVDCRTGEI